MDYTRSPVMDLLKGPLLFTPQGWVVLAICGACWSWAAFSWLTDSPVVIGQDASKGLVMLLAWPLLVFLFYVRVCMPHFKASWAKTAYLVAAAVALPALVLLEVL